MEALNVNIKVSKAHNGAVGYHPGLAAIILQEKQNITSDTANKDHNIEANTKDMERYLPCMFLI